MLFLQQLINGISLGGIYALLATGYSLIYSLLSFSNWAHGEVAMIGAFCAFYSITVAQLPLPVAAAVAVLGSAGISFLNERLFYRRIRDKKAPTMFLMIAAMGLSTIFQGLAKNMFGVSVKIFPNLLPVMSISIGELTIGIYDLVSLAVSGVALIGLQLLINKTKFGLGVRAVACNNYTSSLLGINVDNMLRWVFCIAGGLAGIAGLLLGLKYNASSTMGAIGTKAFVASVFGGLGSVPGAIVGAFILGVSAMILGMTMQTRAEDVYRALIESTAYGTRIIVENFREHGIPVKEFYVSGGICRKNKFAMQIYADVLNMEVHISGTEQGPALGSAIFAACAAGSSMGGYNSVYEAILKMSAPSGAIISPNMQNIDVYDQLYSEYKKLYNYFGRENAVMKKVMHIKNNSIR